MYRGELCPSQIPQHMWSLSQVIIQVSLYTYHWELQTIFPWCCSKISEDQHFSLQHLAVCFACLLDYFHCLKRVCKGLIFNFPKLIFTYHEHYSFYNINYELKYFLSAYCNAVVYYMQYIYLLYAINLLFFKGAQANVEIISLYPHNNLEENELE